MVRLPTGTVTFLFTDIEGSTRLWEKDPASMKAALARHDRILRSIVEEQGGYVFSSGGDAFCVVFEMPMAALQTAIETQAQLVDLDDGETPIRVRMAVHTGVADERDGDYFGPALNRVARLLSVGNGRQVLLGSTTADLVQDALVEGASLVDLGRHRLKDLSRPEHIHRLRHPSMPDDSGDLRSLDRFSHNLPVQATSFVGRENEVAEIEKLVAGSRMVTLTGVGGAGKTRLALQSAAELLSDYDNGVWLIELAPLADPSRVVSAVMDVLKIEEKPAETPLDTTLSWLAERRLLLILDNCEHVIDAAAGFAAQVLASSPKVTILATSREKLGTPGEYAYQVRSLPSPTAADDETGVLLRYPAIRLFTERGEVARPGWRLTSKNAAETVQICQRLDGMPLAIELAAARLNMMNTSQIAEHLNDRFRLLTGGSRTVLPRHQTLEAAINWSHDLLSEQERVLFRRLAVFIGGFTLDAAKTVCGIEPLDEVAVIDQLGHLVDKSLVHTQDSHDEIRYRMLETLRVYARGKLIEFEEAQSVRRRHAEYFLGLAEETEKSIRGPNEEYWISRLDSELDNLRQAMSWGLDSEPKLAQALIGSLYIYLMDGFKSAEAKEWAQAAVEASNEPTKERAKALLAAGTSTIWSADIESALECLDEAIAVARELDASRVLTRALNNKATALTLTGRWEDAEELRLDVVELARKGGSSDSLATVLNNLSVSALGQKDFETAISRGREAVRVAIELGSNRRVEHVKLNLVSAFREHGDLDAAETVLDDIEASAQKVGFPLKPEYQLQRSLIAMQDGDLETAVQQLREAVDRLQEVANAEWETVQQTLGRGAQLLTKLSKPDVSAVLLGASDGIFHSKGAVRYPLEQEQMEKVRDSILELVEAESFQQLFEHGRCLDPREAIEVLSETLQETEIERNGK